MASDSTTPPRHTRRPRERTVEQYFVAECAKRDVLCYKFTAASTIGVPDRVAIGTTTHGTPLTVFVEIKRPGERPRAMQQRVINDIAAHGGYVCVVDSHDAVDAFFAATFDS